MDKLLGYYLPGVSGQTRKWILRGIAGALCVYIGLVVLYILFAPPLISGDEVSHLDYVWLVYHGHLPDFFVGVSLPFSGIPFPPVQWVAQHPPLFYILLAPFVGPLLAAHHAIAAILTGRIISGIFGAMTVLAVPFFINRWGLRKKEVLVMSALLTATVVPLIGVSGAIYNDSLSTLISTISIGMIGLVVIRGPNRKYLVALTASLALGMLTRSLLAVNLVIGCLAIIIGYFNHRKPNEGKLSWLNKGVFASILVVAVTVAASGWYYLRNHRIVGSYSGTNSAWAVEHLHRVPISLHAVLGRKVFQELPLSMFSNKPGAFIVSHAVVLTVPISAILLGAGFFFLVRRLRARDQLSKGLAVIALLGLLSLLMSMVLQAKFATEAGQISTRYLLQCVFFIVFIISFGAYKLGIIGKLAAFGLALGGIISVLDNVMRYTGKHFVVVGNRTLRFPIGHSEASWLAGLCLTAIGLGLVLCAASIFKPQHN